MNQRIQNVINWLKNENIDAAFITAPSNIFYFSQFFTDPHERLVGLAIFQDEEPFLICPQMEMPEVRKVGWEQGVVGYDDTDDPWTIMKQQFDSRLQTVGSCAIEKDHMSVSRYEALRKQFQTTWFVAADKMINELRVVKDDDEIHLLRQACDLVDQAIQLGVNELEVGKTELEIVAKIEYEVKKMGAEMAFSPLVLTGENAASPHGRPGETKIKKGDFVLFDIGVRYQGYCSDISRTVAFGHISKEQEIIYETVLEAQKAAIQAVKKGELAKTLDITARTIIRKKGFGNYFPHRLGHGLGISIHEYPSITEMNELRLQPGMVFTIEPGVYVEGKAGVRIEDDVLVTKQGVEVLTKYPKELQIIN